MAEYERPKAQALSDSELARKLQTFPSDANGIERAGQLMGEQRVLREQDSKELQAWIEFLKARDDEQSRRILSDSIARIFPSEPLDVDNANPEPLVLTSQLPIITRKGKISNRLRGGKIRRLLVTAVLLSVTSTLVMDWLEISNLSAVLASTLGIGIALAFTTALKNHLLHPMLRAAAVFGGFGVYGLAALLLGSTSLFYAFALKGHSELAHLVNIGPYSALLVLLIAGAALLGQLIPVRFGSVLIFLAAFGALILLLAQGFQFDPSERVQGGWIWGAAAVAVLSTLILLVGTPHTRFAWKDSAWLFPITVSLSVATTGTVSFSALNVELAMSVAVFALMLGLVYSGRDLAGGSLGRLAGLSLIIGLVLSPLQAELSGVALSFISSALVLMLMDQIFRTSPLHLASLQTSYGFYGSVSVSGWLALILAGVAGTTFATSLLPDTLNHLEWSLVVGSSIGLVFGLLRIPIIKKQDREIKNIDSSSGNIENLLGL